MSLFIINDINKKTLSQIRLNLNSDNVFCNSCGRGEWDKNLTFLL